MRRANAVAAELVRLGVPRSEIVARGFGETNLLVPTAGQHPRAAEPPRGNHPALISRSASDYGKGRRKAPLSAFRARQRRQAGAGRAAPAGRRLDDSAGRPANAHQAAKAPLSALQHDAASCTVRSPEFRVSELTRPRLRPTPTHLRHRPVRPWPLPRYALPLFQEEGTFDSNEPFGLNRQGMFHHQRWQHALQVE